MVNSLLVCFFAYFFCVYFGHAQNRCPSFLMNNVVDVMEGDGDVSVDNWAFGVSQGLNEPLQVLSWSVIHNRSSFFTVQPHVLWEISNPELATLAFTLRPHAYGRVDLTVSAKDNGGTEGGGCDTSDVKSFVINIVGINDPPSFAFSSLVVTVDEDAGPQTVTSWASSITAGPEEDVSQIVWFHVEFLDHANASIFSQQPAISPEGTLTFSTKLNANTFTGPCRLYVQLRDSGGEHPRDLSCHPIATCVVLVIIVTPVNDLPYFTATSGLISVWENLQRPADNLGDLFYERPSFAVNISQGGGIDEADQVVTFSVTVNTSLPFRVLPHVHVNGSLTFCLAAFANGASQVTVIISDSGPHPNEGTTAVVKVNVQAVNNPPVFTQNGPMPLVMNRNDAALSFTHYWTEVYPGPAEATDERATQEMTVVTSVSPSNLVAAAASLAGTSLHLTVVPLFQAFGNASLLLSITDDGGGSDTVSLLVPILVHFISNVPTIDLYSSSINISEMEGSTMVSDGQRYFTFDSFATNVTAGVGDELVESYELSITASNDKLVNVSLIGSTLQFRTPIYHLGIDGVLLFRVTDSAGLTVQESVDVLVRHVNRCPTFVTQGDISIMEDSTRITIHGYVTSISAGSPVEDEYQELTWFVQSLAASVFVEQPTVIHSASDPTNATLSFRVAPDVWGTFAVNLTLTDDGPITDGGCISTARSFTIHVQHVNDRPSFAALTTYIRVDEDAGLVEFPGFARNVSAGPNEDHQALHFNLTLLDPQQASLFDVQPQVSLAGTLVFRSGPFRNTFNGTVKFKLQLFDDDNSDTSASCDFDSCPTFQIEITPINNLPFFSRGADIVVWEDLHNHAAPPEDLTAVVDNWATGISVGADIEYDEGQVINFIVASNDSSLFSRPPHVHRNGTLEFALRPHFNGVANVSVMIADTGPIPNTGKVVWLVIVVLSVNDVPRMTVSSIMNPLMLYENDPLLELPTFGSAVSPGPPEAPDEVLQTLSVAITAVPSTLFASLSMTVGGGVALLRLHTPPFTWGNATCFVTLQDDGGIERGGIDTLVLNFSVHVLDVNDPPTLQLNRSLVSLLEDAYPGGYTALNFATNISGGAFEGYQGFDIVVTNTNPALFSHQPVVDEFGNLFFTVGPNLFGAATVHVAVVDHGVPPLTVNKSFLIFVTSVNDCPSFAHSGSVTVGESSGLYTNPGWAWNVRAGPPNENDQVLTWQVTTNNDMLFEVLPSVTTTGANGTLSFIPRPETDGVATVSLTLRDDGGTGSGGCDQSPTVTFLVLVDFVNQQPHFVAGTPVIQVAEDAGPVSVNGWASGISRGAANEATQLLWFTLTFMNQSQSELFRQLPHVSPTTGTLTFEAFPNRNTLQGPVFLHVQLFDDGAGGDPLPSCSPMSSCPVLQIVIEAVNDPASFSALFTTLELWEDMGNLLPTPPTDRSAAFSYAVGITPGNEIERVLEGQGVSFEVIASSLAVFAVTPTVSPNGTLHVQLAAFRNGVSTLQIQIRDDGPSPNVGATQSLTVNVLPVNNAPWVAVAKPTIIVAEGSGAAQIANVFSVLSPGPPEAADELSQTLSLTVLVSEPQNPSTLFESLPNFNMASPGNPLLQFETAAHRAGNATIRVTIRDSGGTARNGVDYTIVNITIVVTAVNDPPSFTLTTPSVTVNEGAPPQVLGSVLTNMLAGPFEEWQSLTIHTAVSRPLLFHAQPLIHRNGTLTFTPLLYAFGVSFVDVHLVDDGEPPLSSAVARITITINSVNDPPTFNVIGMVNVTGCVEASECTKSVRDFVWDVSGGPPNEAQHVTFTFSLDPFAAALFDSPPQLLAENTLRFTLKLGVHSYSNPVLMTITGRDPDGTANGGVDSLTRSFYLHIIPQIAPPIFQPPSPSAVQVKEDAPLTTIEGFASNIQRSGFTTAVLIFIVSTPSPELFSVQPSIVKNTDGATGTLSFQPAPDRFGTASVYIVLHDTETRKNGTGLATSITIVPVNDPPSFDVVDVLVYQDSSASLHRIVFNLSLGRFENDVLVSASVLCGNSSLFRVPPALTLDGVLHVHPHPGQSGSTACTVRLRDSGGTANGGVDEATRVMRVTLQRFNHPPRFVSGGAVTVLEDSGEYSQLWATQITAGHPSETHVQQLFFRLDCQHVEELFVSPPLLHGNGLLQFTSKPDAFGVSTCLVELMDDGPGLPPNSNRSGAISFVINVVPVNDAPRFVRGPDVQHKADEGLLRVSHWMTNISVGPPNEADQSLRFVSRNPSPSYAFAPLPSLEITSLLTTADLLIKINNTFSGFATVEICLLDSGGVENGGVDTTCRMLSVSVVAATPRPEFAFLALVEIREDSPPSTITSWVTNLRPPDIQLNITCSPNQVLVDDRPMLVARRDLVVVPRRDEFGSVSCRLNGFASGFSATEDFVVSVIPVNDPPSFEQTLTALFVGQGETVNATIASDIRAGPPNEAHQQVHFVVQIPAHHQGVFIGDVTVSPSGVLFCTVHPSAPVGSARIDFKLVDDGGVEFGGVNTSSSVSIVLQIEFRNRPPTFVIQRPSLTVLESTELYHFSEWVVGVTPGVSPKAMQTVTFSISVSFPTLFVQLPDVFGNGTGYALEFRLAPFHFGECHLNVTAIDSLGAETMATARLLVINVNSPPSFVHQGNITMLEDSITVISAWATQITMGPMEDEVQRGRFIARGFDVSLLAAVVVNITTGDLTVTPQPDAFGETNVEVVLEDDGGLAFGGIDTFITSFKVRVLPVNDPPELRIDGNVVLQSARTEELQVFRGWLRHVAPGPENEHATQSVSVDVTVDDVTFFESLPHVDISSGTLQFSVLRAGATAATITATDSPGLSTVLRFNITVVHVILWLQFSQLLTSLAVEAGAAIEVPVIDVRTMSTHIRSFELVIIDNNTEAFTALPQLSSSGVLSFRTAYRNSIVRFAIDALGPGGERSLSRPGSFSVTVRVPIAVRVVLATPLEAFDVSFFRRVVSSHYNVTVPDVIVISVRPGSTTIDFYIRGVDDWFDLAPQVVSDLIDARKPMRVLLAVNVATIVEQPQSAPEPTPSSTAAAGSPAPAASLLPHTPSPSPSAPSSHPPPLPSSEDLAGEMPSYSPPFAHTDGWFQWGIYAASAIALTAIVVTLGTCIALRRSVSSNTKQDVSEL